MKNDKSKKGEVKSDNYKAMVRLKEFKLIAESNICACIYKEPEVLYNYKNLNLDMFLHNEWKIFFAIAKGIIIDEKKRTLDEITVNLYLEKHLKLKEKYENYGGYEVIEKITEYAKVENLESYIDELMKWNTTIELMKKGFPIADRLSDYADMSIDEIYDEYEALLNHIFLNIGDNDKMEDLADDIDALIDKWDEGDENGLPLYNMPILTQETGGLRLGNINLIGGNSGVGKSSTLRNIVLPSLAEMEEKVVIMCNEEDKSKWVRELLVWVANNVYEKDVQKYKVRNGGYTPEFKSFLKNECANWLRERKGIFIFKSFQTYSTENAVKIIRKYAHLGVNYFILDTFKASQGSNNNQPTWQSMSEDMLKLYDTIKPASLNVSLTITFQLAKNSSKQRYFTLENTGQAKSIVDTAALVIMIRKLFDDELEGENRALNVYKMGGKSGNSKIPVRLNSEKHYQAMFIVKNREGSSNEYQIIVDNDLSRNVVKEVGITSIPIDF